MELFLRPSFDLDPGPALGQPLDTLGADHDLLRRLVASQYAQDLDDGELEHLICSGV